MHCHLARVDWISPDEHLAPEILGAPHRSTRWLQDLDEFRPHQFRSQLEQLSKILYTKVGVGNKLSLTKLVLSLPGRILCCEPPLERLVGLFHVLNISQNLGLS